MNLTLLTSVSGVHRHFKDI